MKLKKSIEKAKQQRMETKKKPTEDAVLTDKIEDIVSEKNNVSAGMGLSGVFGMQGC